MKSAEKLITENLDIWTSSVQTKSAAGRGKANKLELYGIKKLRELILELAVRGLLVPQDPNDEPAGELLKKIAAEKAHLIKEGKIKKTRPPSNEDVVPIFDIPASWAWARLSDIGSIFNGDSVNARTKTEKYTGTDGLPYIATKDVGYGFEPLRYSNGVSIPVDEPKFKVAQQGAVLICSEGGSAGKKCGITDQDICFGNKLYANQLFGGIEPKYVLSLYLTPGFFGRFAESMTGIIGGISTAKFMQLPAPVPPLAEQARIVAKVDELMALCDQLEQQQESSITAHQILVQTLLDALIKAGELDELNAAWATISDHFNNLFTTEWSIDQLKQTILKLAVRGKLVPQDPNDEPASELLKKIAVEKSQLAKDGILKNQKALPAIEDEEKLFQLPDGWEWCRLQEAIDVRDGTHDSPKDALVGTRYPLVTSKNFVDGRIDFDGARRISEEDYLEISKRSFVEVGDILFSMIGGNIGNQVLVQDSRPFSVKNVALFKYFLRSATLPRYLKIYTEELALELQNDASGGAQPFISLGALRKLVFALPPAGEQERIVAKVDELMALCDSIKFRISEVQYSRTQLADVLVELALI